ncbi:MAG TPA: type 2 isopentenyl-diphosphate Delta-isomerase [Chloroflexota bacterium]|nr:type 2 isopentenyl-diphosphate Delta-isomerase [Chloroflexota bacterium]
MRPLDPVEARKAEHLHVSASADVNTRVAAGWDDVHLVHEALPELDFETLDLSVDLFGTGRRLRAPLVLAGMTGGHAAAHDINALLARTAERHGLAIGVGSQRAALRNPALAHTYTVVREQAPTAVLIANLGASQLVAQDSGQALTVADARRAVDMLQADALAIHLNTLEESIQPEGDRRSKGVSAALRAVVQQVGVPVLAKETGAGLSASAALRLRDLGVAALDVGGVGGTSFAAIEGLRAAAQGDRQGQRLGEVLRDWGIPTAVAVVIARAAGLPIIATGGVRSGLDAAKALVLGASAVGVARPLLQAALESEAAVDAWIEQCLLELRTAMFLTGARSIAALQQRPKVIVGETRTLIDGLSASRLE